MIARPVRPEVLRVIGVDAGITEHAFAVLDVDRNNRVTVIDRGRRAIKPAALFKGYERVALVAVEEPSTVHRVEATPNIVKTSGFAGEFRGAADALDLPLASMSVPRWRAILCGRAAVGDETVARALRLRVPSWPERSNDHERDAAGVALACAMTWPACLREGGRAR